MPLLRSSNCVLFLRLPSLVVPTIFVVARMCVVVTRPARRVSSHVALPARASLPFACPVRVLYRRFGLPLTPSVDDASQTTSPYIIASVAQRTTWCPRRVRVDREAASLVLLGGSVEASVELRATPSAMCARSAEPGSSGGAPT